MYLSNFVEILIFTILALTNAKELKNEISSEVSPGESRIVNGTIASLKQFPFMVALRRVITGSLFCGGSIINEKWILTAAHCMFVESRDKVIPVKASAIIASVGIVDLNSVISGYKREISKYIIHESYSSATLRNDAALLRVTIPFNFTNHVMPIYMATKLPLDNTMCVAAGWGHLKENGLVTSRYLQFVQLPLLSRSVCSHLLTYGEKLPRGIICAGYIEGGKDACQGDSGGPLMCDNKLVGIVSGGTGCARPNNPGFYTDVSFYQRWINRTMASGEKSSQSPNASLLLLILAVVCIATST